MTQIQAQASINVRCHVLIRRFQHSTSRGEPVTPSEHHALLANAATLLWTIRVALPLPIIRSEACAPSPTAVLHLQKELQHTEFTSEQKRTLTERATEQQKWRTRGLNIANNVSRTKHQRRPAAAIALLRQRTNLRPQKRQIIPPARLLCHFFTLPEL